MDIHFSTDNLLNLKNNIVFIEGTVVVETDKLSLLREAIASASDEYKKYASKIIKGNLTINDENVDDYSSFTIFIATGDIIYSTEGILDYPETLDDAYNLYIESGNEFRKALGDLKDDIPDCLIRSLYAGVFPKYEFYLINILMIYFVIKEKDIVALINKLKKAINSPEIELDSDRIKEIKYREFIREGIFAGNPQNVKKLFNFVFGIDQTIPDEIKEGYAIRNSIAHRDGHNSKGEKISISKKDVENISNSLDAFVKEFTQKLKEKEEESIARGLNDMEQSLDRNS